MKKILISQPSPTKFGVICRDAVNIRTAEKKMMSGADEGMMSGGRRVSSK